MFIAFHRSWWRSSTSITMTTWSTQQRRWILFWGALMLRVSKWSPCCLGLTTGTSLLSEGRLQSLTQQPSAWRSHFWPLTFQNGHGRLWHVSARLWRPYGHPFSCCWRSLGLRQVPSGEMPRSSQPSRQVLSPLSFCYPRFWRFTYLFFLYFCSFFKQMLNTFCSHFSRWKHTPLDDAVEFKRTSVIEYLKEHAAKNHAAEAQKKWTDWSVRRQGLPHELFVIPFMRIICLFHSEIPYRTWPNMYFFSCIECLLLPLFNFILGNSGWSYLFSCK